MFSDGTNDHNSNIEIVIFYNYNFYIFLVDFHEGNVEFNLLLNNLKSFGKLQLNL